MKTAITIKHVLFVTIVFTAMSNKSAANSLPPKNYPRMNEKIPFKFNQTEKTCEVDGTIFMVGKKFQLKRGGPCLWFTCHMRKGLKVFKTKSKCDYGGKCIGNATKGGCTSYKCRIRAKQILNDTLKVTSNLLAHVEDGCSLPNGVCVRPDQAYKDSCVMYACVGKETGLSLKVEKRCELPDGSCLDLEESLTQNCTIYYCEMYDGKTHLGHVFQCQDESGVCHNPYDEVTDGNKYCYCNPYETRWDCVNFHDNGDTNNSRTEPPHWG